MFIIAIHGVHSSQLFHDFLNLSKHLSVCCNIILYVNSVVMVTLSWIPHLLLNFLRYFAE